MSLTLSGKDKAARVPLDYYGETGSGRKRWGWAVFAILLALAVSAGVFGFWKQAASPGPVHSVHAAWENDCSSCHAGITKPTASTNVLNLFAKKSGHASDVLCKRCHMGNLEQRHHANEIVDEVGSCASCHLEHRGRNSFISRVPDAKCTSCHNNLGKHTQGGATEYAEKITRFDTDHPEFKLGPKGKRKNVEEAIDQGRLRFNHQLHLDPGQGVEWTFAQIKDTKQRKRYMELAEKLTGAKVTETTPVALNCASCHQLDVADDPGRKTPVRSTGDYFLTPTYEQHCRACHPLTFSAAMADVEVPHKIDPGAVVKFLWGAYTEKLVRDPGLQKKLMSLDRPLPGANLAAEEREMRKKIEGQVGGASNVLFKRDTKKASQFVFLGKAACGLCHLYENRKDSTIPEKILPVDVPEVWYPHAKFSHQAHRAMDCKECHPKAWTSEREVDVLIPGVENCIQCHSRERTEKVEREGVSKQVKKGGVRQDCVTCHRYHHGDEPLAGRGASARGVEKRQTIEEWLRGK